MRILNLKWGAIIFAVLFLLSCQEDLIDEEIGDPNTGTLVIEMTDAPIDNASVEGVFVTVTKIELDGVEIDNFNKTTIDVKSLQEGKTEELFKKRISAKNYTSLTLTLDYDKDENGNSPGCYVVKTDGDKDPISSTGNQISLNKPFEIKEFGTTNLVIDFDLRKTIINENEDFELASQNHLQDGLRIVDKTQTGAIVGNCNDLLAGADVVIAFAYKKDEFDRSTELSGNQETHLEFNNAITSSMVNANGNYELHFLEPGDYEIHFAAYTRNTDGSLQLEGTLILELLDGLDLTKVSLGASATVNVDVVATGILP